MLRKQSENGSLSRKHESSPNVLSNTLDTLTFGYVTPLVESKQTRNWTRKDLSNVPPNYDVGALSQKWRTCLDSQKRGGQFSLWRLIWNVFKWDILLHFFIKFLFDVSRTLDSQFVRLFVLFSEDISSDLQTGLLLVVSFFVLLTLRSLYSQQYFDYRNYVALRFTACLESAINDKMLKMSSSSNNRASKGEIMSLLSTDCANFDAVMQNLPQFMSVIVQSNLNLVILWIAVGPSALLALIVPLVVFSINSYLNSRRKQYETSEMAVQDERLKKTSEVFSGIKVVKLMAWEEAMWKTIDSLHSTQQKLFKKASVANMLITNVTLASPFLASVLIFGFLTYFNEDFKMTPKVAFVSITLFEQVSKWPMILASELMQIVSKGLVSYKRLNSFLLCDEIPESAAVKKRGSQKSVLLEDCSFGFTETAKPIVEDVNLELKQNELLVLTGPVGCGKSSLLDGIQGELPLQRGKCEINGSMAFVPQHAWILSGTARENILLDKEFDAEKYKKVVETCQLVDDFKLMANGDSTAIGEKGSNLSGGQRARIALARAVYQDKDIYLLDDPLCAVDAHVAKNIFDKIIGPRGLLGQKIRILVASTDHFFLREADKIGRMQDGALVVNSHMNNGYVANGNAFTTPRVSMENEAINEINQLKENHEEDRINETKSQQQSFITIIGLYSYVIPVIVLVILHFAFALGNGFWLKEWTESNISNSKYHFYIYTLFGILEHGLWTAFLYLSICACCETSRKLHSNLLRHLLRSPLLYFQDKNVGTFSEMFGRELFNINNSWAQFSECLEISIATLKAFVLLIYLAPTLILFMAPMFYFYKQYMINLKTNGILIDRRLNRWIAVRTELIDNLMLFAAATTGVIGKVTETADGSNLAFVFSQIMEFNLKFALRMSLDLLNRLRSIERMQDHLSHATEGATRCEANSSLKNWPISGAVEVRNLHVRYHKTGEDVLRDISIEIKSSEKIGIVGRTGAGKSSFALSLFRILESRSGSILIDDVDISTIGLYDLREALTVIPQEPVLFSGSLRQNLDPTNCFRNEDIIAALKQTDLWSYFERNEGLDFVVKENGQNLSGGQRQLVCLARAILKKTKILVLDEATASVDSQTDLFVQKVIRQQFANCTVITIAHRINTILDSDRVVVMSKGRIVECASPKELLANEKSKFRSLARHSH